MKSILCTTIKTSYIIDRYVNSYDIILKNKIVFQNKSKYSELILYLYNLKPINEKIEKIISPSTLKSNIINYSFIGKNTVNYLGLIDTLLNDKKKKTILDFCRFPDFIESVYYYRNNIKNNAHKDDKYICVPIMDLIDKETFIDVKKRFNYEEYKKRYNVEFIGYDFKDILNIFKTKQCLEFINNIKKKYNNDLDLIIIDPRIYSFKNTFFLTKMFFNSGIYISRMAQIYWILTIITLNISKKGSDLILYFFELPINQEIYNQLIYLISLYYEEVSFMNKYLIAKNFKGDRISTKRNPEDLLSIIEKWNKMDPTGGQFIKLENNEFFDIYNKEFEKANPDLDNKIKNKWNITPVTSVLEFDKAIKNDFTDALSEHYKQMGEYYIDYYTKIIDLYKLLTFSGRTKINARITYGKYMKVMDISAGSTHIYAKECPGIQKNTTNAGLKLFEILKQYKMIPNMLKNGVNSFHLCELPGDFIRVLHGLKIPEWKWWAQSLSDRHSGWAFEDRYGLVKNNPNKYMFGPNKNGRGGTGDICSLKNIDFYVKKLKDEKINFITADCGIWADPLEKMEKSNISSKIMYSQFLTAISILDKGGDYIFKIYGFSDAMTLSYFYLATMIFENVSFAQPMSERPKTSEYYVVCQNYSKQLTTDYFKILYKLHKNYDPDISLFKTSQIDKTFYKNLINILTEIDKKQKKYYEADLQVFKEYREKQEDLQDIVNKKYRGLFLNKFMKLYC
jgi:hypothetical protein